MKQLALYLPISQRTVLVTVETVRAALGVDTETVWRWIDDGTIRWAWDISASLEAPTRANRELRVWARDLLRLAGDSGAFPADPDLSTAVQAVIGHHRPRVTAQELSQTLCCSRSHVHRLLGAGCLSGNQEAHSQWITRESLVQFLTSRVQS